MQIELEFAKTVELLVYKITLVCSNSMKKNGVRKKSVKMICTRGI